jgi:hypothetical protein
MPTFKISQLTTATAVSATNQFEINQNSASRSLEVSVLAGFIRTTKSEIPIVVSVSTVTSADAAVLITKSGPGQALIVNGPTLLAPTSTEGGELRFRNPTGTNTEGLVIDVYTTSNGRIFTPGNNSRLDLGQYDSVPVSAGVVVFATENSEKARITADGKLGIGTSQPVGQLEVYGAGQATYLTFNTSVSLGGALYVRDTGTGGYSGGAVVFGANQGSWAAIKGWLEDGSNNTTGGLSIYSRTSTTDSTLTERVRVNNSGMMALIGSLGRGPIVTKTGNFTVADNENWIICNGSGTITVTLPDPSTYNGREIMIKTVANQAVISASSNVGPLAGGAASTSILSATAGKWATLVSDGVNWLIMQAA